MNTGTLAGRLVADPELTEGTTPRCRFRLAVDSYNSKTRQREAVFFGLVAFGKTAEIIGQYCHKGSFVVVRFHLQPRQWEDKQTGQKRWDTSIVCDEVELGPRSASREPEPQMKEAEPFDVDTLPF